MNPFIYIDKTDGGLFFFVIEDKEGKFISRSGDLQSVNECYFQLGQLWMIFGMFKPEQVRDLTSTGSDPDYKTPTKGYSYPFDSVD